MYDVYPLLTYDLRGNLYVSIIPYPNPNPVTNCLVPGSRWKRGKKTCSNWSAGTARRLRYAVNGMVVVLPEAHLEPPLLFHLVAWTAGWRRRCPRPMLLLPLTYDSCLGSRNKFWNFPDPWQRERERESRIELIWVWTQFRPDPPRISWIHNWWTKNCALWIGYRVTIIHGGFWLYQGTAFALAVTCSSMSPVIAFISQHLFKPIGLKRMTWPPLPGVSSVIGFWGSYMSRLERLAELVRSIMYHWKVKYAGNKTMGRPFSLLFSM